MIVKLIYTFIERFVLMLTKKFQFILDENITHSVDIILKFQINDSVVLLEDNVIIRSKVIRILVKSTFENLSDETHEVGYFLQHSSLCYSEKQIYKFVNDIPIFETFLPQIEKDTLPF